MEEMTKETPLAPAENDCIIELVDLTRVFEDDGMVAVTGAHCFTRGGKVIYHHPVPAEDVERVLDSILEK